MKHLYIALLFLISFSVKAQIIHVVEVGNMSFTPSLFSANLGDTIKFKWVEGTHTATSTSVPGTAQPFDFPMNSVDTVATYVVTTPGLYQYKCNFHPSMTGEIDVVAGGTSIDEQPVDTRANVYPNPFMEELNITYENAEEIALFSLVGTKVKSLILNEQKGTVKFDTSDLPSGIYFYSLIENGAVKETKRIVKR